MPIIREEEERWIRHNDPVSVLVLPNIVCPECNGTYIIAPMGDGLRVHIKHRQAGRPGKCSMGKTDMIRPLAQFMIQV